VDIKTIDENYRALEQQSQATVQALTAVAAKLQTAAKAGDPNAREWLLDLKEVALSFRDEQNQVRDLLRALHGFVQNQVAADQRHQQQIAQAQQQVQQAQDSAQAAQNQAQQAQAAAQAAQAQAVAQQQQQNLQAQGYATPANTPPVQYQQPQVQYVQPAPPPVQYVAPAPAYYPPPAYGYGYGQGYYGGGFFGSGFGEAMVLGAEIGIADAVIDDLFWY
jgi:hypothetical protein